MSAQSPSKRSSQVMQLKAHPKRTGWQLKLPCGGMPNFKQEVDPFVPSHTRIEIDRFPTVSASTVAVVYFLKSICIVKGLSCFH